MLYEDLTKTVGNTPMLHLNRFKKGELKAEIYAKLECFNPLSSIKDRAALSMIEDAEEKGLLKKGAVVVEPTSGNTGVGLAFVCAIKGYKLILTMPESMSIERRKLLAQLGAELVLTEASKGMTGSVEKAFEIAATYENAFIPNQFENQANADAHRKNTALEIINDMGGNIDIFVAGVGCGGTITGVGEILKLAFSDVKVVAVEPDTSPLLSKGYSGAHGIQGIGANFIPKLLNRDVIDEVITVSLDDAIACAKELARTEGVLVGISSGAALKAAYELAKKEENVGKNIVVILPDTGERYISSKLFD